jgi:hypothetical protein
MTILFLIIANFVLSIIVANAGERREIGFIKSFFISLFFGGLIGILIVLASERIEFQDGYYYPADNSPKDAGQIDYDRIQKNPFTGSF